VSHAVLSENSIRGRCQGRIQCSRFARLWRLGKQRLFWPPIGQPRSAAQSTAQLLDLTAGVLLVRWHTLTSFSKDEE
jgi:hypothetical protein